MKQRQREKPKGQRSGGRSGSFQNPNGCTCLPVGADAHSTAHIPPRKNQQRKLPLKHPNSSIDKLTSLRRSLFCPSSVEAESVISWKLPGVNQPPANKRQPAAPSHHILPPLYFSQQDYIATYPSPFSTGIIAVQSRFHPPK